MVAGVQHNSLLYFKIDGDFTGGIGLAIVLMAATSTVLVGLLLVRLTRLPGRKEYGRKLMPRPTLSHGPCRLTRAHSLQGVSWKHPSLMHLHHPCLLSSPSHRRLYVSSEDAEPAELSKGGETTKPVINEFSSPKRVVVVAGATGRVGRMVVQELLSRGHEVRALARDTAKAEELLLGWQRGCVCEGEGGHWVEDRKRKHDKNDCGTLRIVECDLGKRRQVRQACESADVGIWAASGISNTASQGNRIAALFGQIFFPKVSIDVQGVETFAECFRGSGGAACRRETSAGRLEQTPRVVVVSSSAVTRPSWSEEKKAAFPGVADIPIVRLNPLGILDTKAEGEDRVRRSGAPYCVLRPCGLNDDWPTGRPILSQGDLSVGRINRRDVAILVCDLLDEPQAVGKTIEAIALAGYPKAVGGYDAPLARLKPDGHKWSQEALEAQYGLLQQLLPGETQDSAALAMGQTYEQLDRAEEGRLGPRGEERFPRADGFPQDDGQGVGTTRSRDSAVSDVAAFEGAADSNSSSTNRRKFVIAANAFASSRPLKGRSTIVPRRRGGSFGEARVTLSSPSSSIGTGGGGIWLKPGSLRGGGQHDNAKGGGVPTGMNSMTSQAGRSDVAEMNDTAMPRLSSAMSVEEGGFGITKPISAKTMAEKTGLEVLACTPSVVVVNKPSGLKAVPAFGPTLDSLTSRADGSVEDSCHGEKHHMLSSVPPPVKFPKGRRRQRWAEFLEALIGQKVNLPEASSYRRSDTSKGYPLSPTLAESYSSSIDSSLLASFPAHLMGDLRTVLREAPREIPRNRARFQRIAMQRLGCSTRASGMIRGRSSKRGVPDAEILWRRAVEHGDVESAIAAYDGLVDARLQVHQMHTRTLVLIADVLKELSVTEGGHETAGVESRDGRVQDPSFSRRRELLVDAARRISDVAGIGVPGRFIDEKESPKGNGHADSILTALLRVFALSGDVEGAKACLERIETLGLPVRLRALSPLFSAMATFGNTVGCTDLWDYAVELGITLGQAELAVLLPILPERVLAELEKRHWTVSDASLATALEAHFHGLGWHVGLTRVNNVGICEVSGSMLRPVDIGTDDMIRLADLSERLATDASPRAAAAFSKFREHVEAVGPFDVLIDGANVGFLGQNFHDGAFSHRQIDQVVRTLERQGKRVLLVLHERWLSPSVDLSVPAKKKRIRQPQLKDDPSAPSRHATEPLELLDDSDRQQSGHQHPKGQQQQQQYPTNKDTFPRGGIPPSAVSSDDPSTLNEFSEATDGGEATLVVAASTMHHMTEDKGEDDPLVDNVDFNVPPAVLGNGRNGTDVARSGDSDDMDERSRIIRRWKRDGIVYAVPARTNDDWFWIYGAVRACLQGKDNAQVVSNDLMRDHHWRMMAPETFIMWQRRHQTKVIGIDPDSGRIEFDAPAPFSSHVQKSPAQGAGCSNDLFWHFPLDQSLAGGSAMAKHGFLSDTAALSNTGGVLFDRSCSKAGVGDGERQRKEAAAAGSDYAVPSLMVQPPRVEPHGSDHSLCATTGEGENQQFVTKDDGAGLWLGAWPATTAPAPTLALSSWLGSPEERQVFGSTDGLAIGSEGSAYADRTDNMVRYERNDSQVGGGAIDVSFFDAEARAEALWVALCSTFETIEKADGMSESDSVLSRVQKIVPSACPIHRLDEATSGAMAIALTPPAARSLSQQWRQRGPNLLKGYIADVRGTDWRHLSSGSHDGSSSVGAHGTISLPLSRVPIDQAPSALRESRREEDPLTPMTCMIVDEVNGKACTTVFRVVSVDEERDVSRVELTPVTGRQHQLRAHMSAVGHPILGDTLYGTKASRNMANRLHLHAGVLGFIDPGTRNPVLVECDHDWDGEGEKKSGC